MTNHLEQLDNLNLRIKLMVACDVQKAKKEINAMAWKHEFRYLCDAAGIKAEMRRLERMRVLAEIRQIFESIN